MFLYGQLAVGLLCLVLCASSIVLDKIELDQHPFYTCAQDLLGCSVKDEFFRSPDSSFVKVSKLDLRAFLCCKRGRDCTPCFKIQVHLYISGLQDYREHSGDNGDEVELEEGSVSLCYSIPHVFSVCKRLKFRLPPAALEDHLYPTIQLTLSLLLSENVNFGSQALVWGENVNQTISIPSLTDVCSPDQWEYVKECNGPRLQTVIDKERGVAVLQLDKKGDVSPASPLEMCHKYGDKGECKYQQWTGTDISIPLHSIPSCLCFQVRRKDDLVVWSSCPFSGMDSEEFLRNTLDGVRVSVVPAQTNSGGPALAWNLTAPCRLEVELWLCRVGGAEQGCREVIGSRQRVENNGKTERGWSNGEHWIKGEFLDITPHPSVCVLVKVNGTDRVLGPWCPFSATRRRWVFSAVLGILLLIVAVLGACVLHHSLKSWVRHWCKDSDQAPVGGAHVLLICPPDVSPSLASQVSRLGSALCKLGFSVTADLWSRAQLGALGPVPWLHAQLSHLEQEGGRAVLILTREALEGAGQSGGRETRKGQAPSPYTDVFAAALGCVVADHLQGSARGRFTLAHFEPLPLGGALGPLQLSGTRPYSLPAQSLGFLAELTGRRGAGLWLGSRTLDQVLRRQDGVSKLKDLGEAVPLKGADTPHTSPQTSTQHCWDAHCV
ncbi:hypothetical protein AGOR_G00152540 [Albula goreensis]|uniref:Interleukin 17 receptor C n=1 Tax=Albula goreensis TaxID=1534307 RepID=A0A8T3D2S8_9TELE|nr:hypothetical protein AGOR_G00152540 [Albula goreensis]